ncbi:unnamed protein product [Blepharisma stoltei]|uniref:cholesterol 7-desaturase n=1 Tax=Blepharisma stoltei TaxID=1481888 RepID=A0AAU9KCR9_9CILI|nr:unnamed protein product [Blepharisma stoltei]
MLENLDFLFSTNYIIITIAIILYALYVRKYRHYVFEQSRPFTKGRRSIGKTLPPYPNGWFCVARSSEIKKGEAKHIDYNGQNIAVFRGTDGVVYAIDAYCAHMGANLAEGGKVKFTKGLQCPFHGWIFDGSTGNCVTGPDMKPKELDKYAYTEVVNDAGVKLPMPKLCCKEQVKVKKWQVREMFGFIFVWYHAIENLRIAPPSYEPLDISDFTKRLSYRGHSINKVKSFIQDVPENGGDLMHFLYVHYAFLPFTDAFKAKWRASWYRGDDPELREKVAHEIGYINDHKMRLLDKYLDEGNKSNIGILTLDNYIILPGGKEIFFLNATGFQVGSGIVYLFLIGPFFEGVFFQHLRQIDKHNLEVYHEMWASNYLPYGITAIMLRGEAQQVMNDGKVWDNKQFAMKPNYNMMGDPDKLLLKWRNWYAQFFEGCEEAEKAKEKLSW